MRGVVLTQSPWWGGFDTARRRTRVRFESRNNNMAPDTQLSLIVLTVLRHMVYTGTAHVDCFTTRARALP